MKKRIISLFLAAIMLLSLVPMAVLAAEPSEKIAFVYSKTASSEHFELTATDLYENYWAVGDADCHETITISVKPGNNLLITKIEAIVTMHSDHYQDVTVSSGVKQETSGVTEGATVHINEINAASVVIDGVDDAYDIGFRDITVYYKEVVPHTHGTGNDAIVFDKEIKTFGDLQNLFATGGRGYLSANITATEGLTVAEDTDLCLNDKVLNLDGKGNIIVDDSKTFNLYDCGKTVRYYDKNATTGLWTLKTDGTSDYSTTGGVITGGNTATNGGGVYVSGTFNMAGGTIVGNKAETGGGVSNFENFTMTGGAITGNAATTGGGIYTTANMAVNILVGGTVTGNTATNGGGLYYKEEECFAQGTLITMADGTRKAIETLGIGDLVRVFDHETGKVSSAKVFDFGKYPEKHGNAVILHFADQIDVTVVYGHSFFEKEQNKYVSVTKDNVAEFVGHEFYNVDDARFEKLVGYDFVDEKVDTYTITTEHHLNCVANGMLSNEDGFYTIITNIFEYGKDLKIDADKKASDIEKYGLLEFDELNYASKETFDALNLQYMSVAFGKGMITPEEAAYIEAYWTGITPEIYCEEEQKQTEKPALLMKSLKAAPLGTPAPAPAPTTPGVYVGGSIRITDNTSGNLCLASGKALTLGTGTVGAANGVAAPTSDFKIGVSTMTAPTSSAPVQFSTNGTAEDLKYFTSDNTGFDMKFNTSGYLELALHTHAPALAGGQAATESAAGFKDYYKCSCGKFFEDSEGKVEITDLNAWKAEGGKGYIAPLVHSITPVNGKNATDTEAGYKPYYECKNCGKFFEDSEGKVEITDLEKWKAQGGNGYLPQLEKKTDPTDPKSPKTGDTSNMTLWLAALVLSFAGICALPVLDKKRFEK